MKSRITIVERMLAKKRAANARPDELGRDAFAAKIGEDCSILVGGDPRIRKGVWIKMFYQGSSHIEFWGQIPSAEEVDARLDAMREHIIISDVMKS